MKKLAFIAILALCAGVSAGAKAEPKPCFSVHAPGKWIGGWWPGHWKNQDYQPYYDYSKDPHNSQWEGRLTGKQWTPADWINQEGGNGERLIQKWYSSGIIRDQYVTTFRQRPILKVGPNFYHLSGEDKRRVMAVVDAVYGATSQSPNMFYLLDWDTTQIIGYYSKGGLVLQ